MPDLIFLHGGHTARCTARVDKRFDGYCSLQLSARGGVALQYDGRGFELGGTGVWGCWPGPRIRFHAAGVSTSSTCGRRADPEAWWEHRYVAFAGERVERWEEDGLWPLWPQLLALPAAGACRALLDDLLRDFSLARGGERAARLACVHRLEGILIEALREREEASAPREAWLEEALGWLGDEANAWPDYQVLAQRCGMGLSTLRRKFKAATGRTLHEHTLSLRAERARRLLIETDWPLKAIASRLGYSDPFFFAAQFKALAGVPPAAFRKSRM